eukprot:1711115-Amphidinium_carterae.1
MKSEEAHLSITAHQNDVITCTEHSTWDALHSGVISKTSWGRQLPVRLAQCTFSTWNVKVIPSTRWKLMMLVVLSAARMLEVKVFTALEDCNNKTCNLSNWLMLARPRYPGFA